MDQAAQQAAQQGAAVGAALTLVGTVAGLFFGYLKDRDKLRYDSKIQALELQNAQQARDMEQLRAQHRQCEEEHRRTQAEVAEIRHLLEGKRDMIDPRDTIRTDPD